MRKTKDMDEALVIALENFAAMVIESVVEPMLTTFQILSNVLWKQLWKQYTREGCYYGDDDAGFSKWLGRYLKGKV